MGVCRSLLALSLLVSPLVFYLFINDRLLPKPDPAGFLPERKWFGPGKDTVPLPETVKPFQIKVHDAVIENLRKRLDMDFESLAKPIQGVGFNYGFNTDYLKNLIAYWRDEYDWRPVEAKANSFPQFTTYIDGINLHFFHIKPKDAKGKKVVPLLLLHGWPGSFLEFIKIFPMLTTPRKDSDVVFEVVAPSIPGFGYSSAPAQEGFDALQAGRVLKELMARLGHEKFYTQAGDWGSMITGVMATLYPENILGYHSNFVQVNTLGGAVKRALCSVFPSLFKLTKEEEPMVANLGQQYVELLTESGYLHEQATKPDTIGVSLTTSPSGLAAWILEKFSTATSLGNRDKYDGGLTEKFTKEELISDVMLYWVTRTGGTAARFYLENMGRRRSNYMTVASLPVLVPTGVAIFPNEFSIMPRAVLENKFKNMVTYNVMPKGGHFAAMEEPELLAKDLFAFVDIVEAQRRASNKREEL